MGRTVKAQINHTHPYVFSVQRLNELIFMIVRSPWYWLKPLWYVSGYGFEFDRHLKIVTDFTRQAELLSQKTPQVIDKRIEDHRQKKKEPTKAAQEVKPQESAFAHPPKKRSVFLDMLIELQEEGKLNYEDIREEVDTFMFEGPLFMSLGAYPDIPR